MKKRGLVYCGIALICGTLFAFLPPQAGAAVYKCIGRDGSVRYTDVMNSASCSPMVLRQMNSFDSMSGYRYSSRNSRKFDDLIRYYGVRYNVDPHLIRAVIRTESGFNPQAVSKRGAQGLMQLMPGTARELRVNDPLDPKQNIEGGTRYLSTLLSTFKNDIRLALAAYNAGPNRVKRIKRVPEIYETKTYVKRVLEFYKLYKEGA